VQGGPPQIWQLHCRSAKTDSEIIFLVDLKLHLRPVMIAIILPWLASARWVPEKQNNEFRRKRLHAPAGEENHA
jgi:hypothetical protein